MVNPHKGSSFDDFLKNENLLNETTSLAIKRVIAYQLTKIMQQKKISKTKMAHQMHTSRASLDRLLDPDNMSVTLNTLVKAAEVLGKEIKITFR